MTELEKILRESYLFKEVDEDIIHRLAQESKTLTLSPREHLFHEGDRAAYFYVLLTGAVRVYKLAPDGRETTIKIVQPGEIFGEAALFENDIFPASVVAAKKSRIYALPVEHFHRMLEDPFMRDEFISSLIKKLRYLTGRIHEISTYDVEERFFRFIRDHYGEHESYDVDMSKKDLAAAIGTVPETLSRLIMRLEKRGIIKWKARLEVQPGFWEKMSFDE